jgi:hypothetical protein
MLVDKLRVTVAPQEQAEIVEPGDNPLQLDSVEIVSGVLVFRT